MGTSITSSHASQLLHNKFVVILGASVQRGMYKDLVLLLKRNGYLTLSQLKSKGELSFEGDSLVEGGRLNSMSNGTGYKEVRQYRTDHHLVRFYFITQMYSPYMESILEDFRGGLKPDLIIVNSCLWDLTRYGSDCAKQYRENLHHFFNEIKTVCHDSCLILWTPALPVAKKIKGGFLVPEVSHLGPSLCYDIIEANFYSSRLANVYGLDILDLHFYFRVSLQHRMPDGVHWDAAAHRRMTCLVLQHAAEAWGVKLHEPPEPGPVLQCNRGQPRHCRPHPRPQMNRGFPPPARGPWMFHFHRQPAMQGARFPRYYHRPVYQHYFPCPAGRLPSPHRRTPPPPSPHPRQYFPAGRRAYCSPLPPSSPWRGQHVNLRPTCSHVDFRWRAGFDARQDERCMRRRRRQNIRTHPYPRGPW